MDTARSCTYPVCPVVGNTVKHAHTSTKATAIKHLLATSIAESQSLVADLHSSAMHCFLLLLFALIIYKARFSRSGDH